MPSPRPSDCMRLANMCSGGSMCGAGFDLSDTSSRSRKTAPGMWPASYSARASRPSPGRKAVASTTRRSGAPSSASSQSVETRDSIPLLPSLRLVQGRLGLNRHCEQSEAIQSGRGGPLDCRVPRIKSGVLAMTEWFNLTPPLAGRTLHDAEPLQDGQILGDLLDRRRADADGEG